MSRSRNTKRATTKKSVKARRAKNGKAERVKALARRFGLVFGFGVFAIWLGAWLFISGAVPRGAAWSQNKIYELAGDAGFAVQNILVEGRINSDADVLKALINIERGDPIFAFDPKDAKSLIERIAWVKEAHVERRLPGTIYIGLVERKPVALWQNKKKIRVIDSEGVTLTDRRIEPFKDLIILVGESAPQHAPDLLAFLAVEPLINDKIEAAIWIGERRWDLKLKNGIKVKLPENDMGLALRRLAKAQAEDGLLEKDLIVVDMREADRITVRTRPGAVKEYKAGLKGNNI